jgi:SAM-dependent methyltransferase
MTPSPKHASYSQARLQYWESYWAEFSRWHPARKRYRAHIEKLYRFVVPPTSSVLEIGCGAGHLIASLGAKRAVGVDFSPTAIALGQKHNPQVTYILADAHDLELSETFDYIILSDLVNELWDVQAVLETVKRHCHRRTRVLINSYSHLWAPFRRLAEFLGIAKPQLQQNWITPEDVQNLLFLSGLEAIRRSGEVLCPLPIPLFAALCNRYLVRFFPFSELALTNFFIARLQPQALPTPPGKVTVVVAARNEEGNVPDIFSRTPEMGAGTELIFVEGGSKDNTYAAIEREMSKYPGRDVQLFKQPGKGKGDAVRKGFSHATGEVLMILDADLTVPPEDLPRFYEAWRSGRGEYINGVRLVYPMEDQAMRFANLIANKFFAIAFSWLLNQPIKDTLCGTKVMSRTDYETIAANRAYFGDFDPYGDFDLIFGAARYNLKMLDLPIRYAERTYGETNINRWSGGVVLLRMVIHAMRRIKFI